jgi:hypothetical protein
MGMTFRDEKLLREKAGLLIFTNASSSAECR